MPSPNALLISNWASREKAKDPAISFLTDKVESLFGVEPGRVSIEEWERMTKKAKEANHGRAAR